MLLLEVSVGVSVDTFDTVITGFSGEGDTVTVAVVLLHPVAVDVKVNVTVPAETPVINPVVLLIVATPGVLLTHVPPAGLEVIVVPEHIVANDVVTVGSACTVMDDVVTLQPDTVNVNVKVTAPAEIPVINPALSIVAILGSLLTHVPFVVGLAVIVAPMHNEADGKLTDGTSG